MRITIEDLESLRELNDELEENHVETEKAMQEEISAPAAPILPRPALISTEQTRRTCSSTFSSARSTISRRRAPTSRERLASFASLSSNFRRGPSFPPSLITSLPPCPSELDALRSQTQTAQTEFAAATSQTAQMMSLNLKLQSTASKHQARTIDMEVYRIDAREAREMLAVVQPYLPAIYADGDDVDAARTYFFFKRLAAKAELINAVVATAHGLPDALAGAVHDALVGVAEMRGAIAALAVVCRRFAAILRRCDVESFLSIGRLFAEIAPMERRLDLHIDLLRREEFRDRECVVDINKCVCRLRPVSGKTHAETLPGCRRSLTTSRRRTSRDSTSTSASVSSDWLLHLTMISISSRRRLRLRRRPSRRP
jgi:dynactin 1